MVNVGELEVSAVKNFFVYIPQLSVQLQTVDTSLFANSAQYNTETEQNSKSNSTLLVLKANVIQIEDFLVYRHIYDDFQMTIVGSPKEKRHVVKVLAKFMQIRNQLSKVSQPVSQKT